MGSNFALPLRSCVTLGKSLTISGTVSLSETGEKAIVSPSQSGGENETRYRMGSASGTRCFCCYYYLCCYYCFPGPSRRRRGPLPPVPPDPSLGTLGSSSSSCKLPKPAPAHSALPGGWHQTRREQEAGTGGQPTAASADGHHLGWRGSGRAGSCRSGRAWQPLPLPPWHGARPRLRFLRPPEGAGRPGWASGLGRRLPSLGPAFSRLLLKWEAGERRAGSPAPGLPNTRHRASPPQLAPVLWAIPAPGPLH